MNKLAVLILLHASALKFSASIKDGLHPTPMMGWSSWNTFFADNDQEKMEGIADAIIDLELDKFGYLYLTVDDYWNTPDRDVDGNMIVNTTRFPDGMRRLGDYLHDRGLKYGIYSDAGDFTCGGMAGSLGYEEQDLQLFLSFDIDYLKYDNCYPNGTNINVAHNYVDVRESFLHLPSFYQFPSEEERFLPMVEAIESSGKNITFELCLYGWGNVEIWGPDAGHLWRTGYDAADIWISALMNLDRNDEDRFLDRQGPELGAWNYPDALFVGKGGMSMTEYRSTFSLWCAVKSPLMLGMDLRDMKKGDEAYQIITNTDLLAINQDVLGKQARCVKDCCGKTTSLGGNITPLTCPHFSSSWQIWQGPLSDGAFVVVVLNRFDHVAFVEMDWKIDAKIPDGDYVIRDLWLQKDLGIVSVGMDLQTGNLDKHDNWAFKLTPVDAGFTTSTTTTTASASDCRHSVFVLLTAVSILMFLVE